MDTQTKSNNLQMEDLSGYIPESQINNATSPTPSSMPNQSTPTASVSTPPTQTPPPTQSPVMATNFAKPVTSGDILVESRDNSKILTVILCILALLIGIVIGIMIANGKNNNTTNASTTNSANPNPIKSFTQPNTSPSNTLYP